MWNIFSDDSEIRKETRIHNSQDEQEQSILSNGEGAINNMKVLSMASTCISNDAFHCKSHQTGKRPVSVHLCLTEATSESPKERLKVHAELSSNEHLDSDGDEICRNVVRKQIVAIIAKRLEQAEQELDHYYPVATLAQLLENHLFSTAPSFEAYADQGTLNSRLRLITVALMRRRLQRGQKHLRSNVLKAHLGLLKYNEVMQLVHIIKALKFARVSISCASCPREGPCDASSIPAQRVLPQEVRNIFFNTHLLQAVESVAVERIPQLPWDMMIGNAKANIRAYQDWNDHARA